MKKYKYVQPKKEIIDWEVEIEKWRQLKSTDNLIATDPIPDGHTKGKKNRHKK